MCEAKCIRLKLERLETAFMTVFWGFILIHKTNKKLQSVDIDICTVIHMYDTVLFKFRVTIYLVIIDRLVAELQKRRDIVKKLNATKFFTINFRF